MTSILELQHMACHFGKHHLLTDINWVIRPGEKWMVFGENGSGKTTLLSTLAGYRNPQSGILLYKGKNRNDMSYLEYRKQIGFVSTSFFQNLYHGERVMDIVLSAAFGTAGISGFNTNTQLVRAKQLLTQLNITHTADKPFYMLSKGEQQCVLLARAFFTEPTVLLLDEADSGLDYVARLRLLELLEQMTAEREITLVYVTHYPGEIPECITHGLLLKNRRIFRQGRLEDVFTHENMSAFFERDTLVELQPGGYGFTFPKEGC